MRTAKRWASALTSLLAVACGIEGHATESLPVERVGSTAVAPLLAVVADDSRVRSPGRVPPGPGLIRFFNRGGEPHRLQLVRLDPDRSPPELWDHLVESGLLPEWAPSVGDSGTIGPGVDAEVRVRLTPGRYVLLCSRTSADGRTHLERGMIRVLRVTGAAPEEPRDSTVGRSG